MLLVATRQEGHMPKVLLTDRFCAHAKPQAGQDRTPYRDTTTKGLELLVSDKTKAWYYRFDSPKDSKRAVLKIGSYPSTLLGAARTKALEAKGAVDDGVDPRDMGRSVEMTVADLVTSYLDKHVRPKLKSARHMELRLAANVLPAIGTLRLADLHRRDINRVLDPIMARNCPTQARLVFQDMRAMLRWAVSRGDLDRSPMEGLDRPSTDKPRERVLSDDEIRVLWAGLPDALPKSKTCQRIIKLCLVTGQRVGEVAGMTRAELDLAGRSWSLPGSRTKNGHGHLVPLADLAMAIIGEALADAGNSPFVFPCGSGSLAPTAVARTIVRAHEPSKKRPLGRFGVAHWTAHDLRRTALTGMARLGVSPTVLGFVANHRTMTRGGVTMGVYVHYTYEAEKRQALDLWADRLQAIVAGQGADVVPMQARA
jgi:integrase